MQHQPTQSVCRSLMCLSYPPITKVYPIQSSLFLNQHASSWGVTLAAFICGSYSWSSQFQKTITAYWFWHYNNWHSVIWQSSFTNSIVRRPKDASWVNRNYDSFERPVLSPTTTAVATTNCSLLFEWSSSVSDSRVFSEEHHHPDSLRTSLGASDSPRRCRHRDQIAVYPYVSFMHLSFFLPYLESYYFRKHWP